MPKGHKYFHVTKSIALELLKRHDGLLKSTFIDTINEVLPIECKTAIQIRPFKRIAKVSFFIYFGFRIQDSVKMCAILDKVADMTIMKVMIDQQVKAFNKLKHSAVQESLIYKPKEIQKIC